MKQYELWRSEAGNSDSFFAADNQSARNLLEFDARLVWTCAAKSWDEAQQKRYEFMKWGDYGVAAGLESSE